MPPSLFIKETSQMRYEVRTRNDKFPRYTLFTTDDEKSAEMYLEKYMENGHWAYIVDHNKEAEKHTYNITFELEEDGWEEHDYEELMTQRFGDEDMDFDVYCIELTKTTITWQVRTNSELDTMKFHQLLWFPNARLEKI